MEVDGPLILILVVFFMGIPLLVSFWALVRFLLEPLFRRDHDYPVWITALVISAVIALLVDRFLMRHVDSLSQQWLGELLGYVISSAAIFVLAPLTWVFIDWARDSLKARAKRRSR